MVRFYVSTDGRDSFSGTLPAPNDKRTDGPFATLERARDAVRELRRKNGGGLPEGGVTVYIRGGRYERRAALELGPEDSGSAGSPVVYTAYKNEQVRLSGGRVASGWRPVTNQQVLARLVTEAKAKVLQCDLKALGITDYGRLARRGFGIGTVPAALELFFKDKPMQIARWPNEGWTRIGGTPAGQQGGVFTYEGDRPSRWKPSDDIWVHGYWTWDWADSYERVKSIDTTKREVHTVEPHGVYGYTPGKRFYFLNVLEELDQPGEWYLDRHTGILYFWPPEPIDRATAVVSLLEAPLVIMRDVSHIAIRGIIFECSRGSGVQVTGGAHCIIADCTFRNLGTNAVDVNGGFHHQVVSCHIHDVGESGINLSGGDRRTLTPGRHAAVNNHIHHYSRWCKTYRPAIGVNGVGNRIAHNLIHDAPHNAVLLGGNEHVIEFNEIHHVCQQTGDAGAVYMGRDLTMRGNIIRYNYFHDIAPTIAEGQGFTDVMAVYLDDCFCGTTVYGNLFRRAGRAAMIGGGRDNTIENNVFIDCNPSVHVDARGRGWASFWFDGRDPTLMDRLKAVNHTQPPYSTRYPKLATILDDEPAQAKGNRILRNICVGGKWIELFDGLDDRVVEIRNNLTDASEDMLVVESGVLKLKNAALAARIGFRPIPVGRMGLKKSGRVKGGS
ncbi:MAG: right-handed parallel beta-helix repeat-containing protein [Armatimonadota bacterium]